jgi:sugar/nucleoside kinase (ribokinase family)
MPRVLVVGDVMTDVLARLDEPFARGSDAAARISERPGGSAATFAARLAQAGVAVDFVGRVGAADVERISDAFRRAGVTPWLAGDPVAPTGRLIAVVEPSGERSFLTDRGANDALALADIPLAAFEGASWLHLTGYSFQHPETRAVARALLARAGGVPVSVDPGSAAPLRAMGAANFLNWTAGAALLLPNADEAAALTGQEDPRHQRAQLANCYPLVVIKRGAAGAEAIVGDRIWSTPAPPTAVVDTTGAGDAFAAAFIAARLNGDSIETCLERAVEAGAAATRVLGGWPL